MKRYIVSFLVAVLLFVSCSDPTQVQKVELSFDQLTLNIGETVQIEAQLRPLSAYGYNRVSWRSSDTDVATVDNLGNVTAVYAGECEIKAQSGGKSDVCRITVVTETFDFRFVKAYAKGGFDVSGAGTNHIELYLLEEGLEIDTDDFSMSGEGAFLRFELESVWQESGVASGVYNVSEWSSAFSFYPGYVDGGNPHGSYMGVYDDTKLSVYPIVKGEFAVDGEGGYYFEGSFDCLENEHIDAVCDARAVYISGSGALAPVSFQYTDAVVESKGKTANEEYKILSVTLLSDESERLSFNLIVPLSTAGAAPVGVYVIDGELSPFHIIPYAEDQDKGAVFHNDEIGDRPLLSGRLKVEDRDGKLIYHANFVDIDGRIITSQAK